MLLSGPLNRSKLHYNMFYIQRDYKKMFLPDWWHLCRVRPRYQRGELRGLLLARVLLQLQEVLSVSGQQALRHHCRTNLLPRLRQEAVNGTRIATKRAATPKTGGSRSGV